MQSVRLALFALLCCLVMRNGAAQFDGPDSERSSDQLPGDDHGPMPAPAEGEEGELPLLKLKVEAETWTPCLSWASATCEPAREEAEVIGGTYFSSRELFNSLHRLRI